jgi:LemA protein
MQKIDTLIGQVSVEAYPSLQTGGLHESLMTEIRITEDRINAARTGYNTVIREFNSSVVSFPNSLVAKQYHFEVQPYYETNRKDVSGTAPQVQL